MRIEEALAAVELLFPRMAVMSFDDTVAAEDLLGNGTAADSVARGAHFAWEARTVAGVEVDQRGDAIRVLVTSALVLSARLLR